MKPARKCNRIWLVSVVFAAISSVPVALCVHTIPWLIAVPIIVGAVLVAVLQSDSATNNTKPKDYGK